MRLAGAAVILAAVVASGLCAQSDSITGPTSANSQTGNIGQFTATNAVIIRSVGVRAASTTTGASIQVWFNPVTASPGDANWTAVGTAVVNLSAGTVTPVPVNIDVLVPASQVFGICYVITNATGLIGYLNGPVSNTSDANLTISGSVGWGGAYNAANTPAMNASFSPRVFCGTVFYDVVGDPEIEVRSSGASLGYNGLRAIDLGTASGAISLPMSVENQGATATLTLTTPFTVTVNSGAFSSGPAANFSGSGSLAPSAGDAFTIDFTPAGGPYDFDVTIASNDADEASYTINISGLGGAEPTVAIAAGAGFTGDASAGFDIAVFEGAALATAALDVDDADTASIDITVSNGAAPGITAPASVTGANVPLTLAWSGTAGATPGLYTYTVDLDDGIFVVSFDVRIRIVPAIGRPDLIYYRLNEGTGDTTENGASPGAGSASPQFSDGTTPVTPTWDSAAPRLGAACVDFAGSTLLDTGMSTGLITGDFTFEFWLRLNSITGNQAIISDGTAVNGDMVIWFSGSQNRVNWGSSSSWGGGVMTGPSGQISAGQWNHFAFAYDDAAATLTMYMNGGQVAQLTAQSLTVPASNQIVLGSWDDAALSIPLNGSIDEFRLRGASLTADEILAGINTEFPPPDQEIELERAGNPLASGTTDNVGTLQAGATVTFTWDVLNSGSIDSLTISGIGAAPTGAANCSVNVVSGATPFDIVAQAQDSFDVELTPTAAGPFEFTITITSNDADEGTYTLIVQGTAFAGVAPAITSGTPPTSATVNVAYSFQFTATGTPTPTLSATGLPGWLTLNPTTGLLTGTPTAADIGLSGLIVVTAGNGVTPDATQNFTINVQAPGGNGGDGDSKDEGCSSGTGHSWLVLALLLAATAIVPARQRNAGACREP